MHPDAPINQNRESCHLSHIPTLLPNKPFHHHLHQYNQPLPFFLLPLLSRHLPLHKFILKPLSIPSLLPILLLHTMCRKKKSTDPTPRMVRMPPINTQNWKPGLKPWNQQMFLLPAQQPCGSDVVIPEK